ncbi:CHC2 zinc finger domain-containing protein [Pigmentibacter sp. JX0631]|uniref:toprim domain-containing protein n=1 Tax=Pigmentibacter sp. JX0631 TaxID=2976982 RepID=UPI002468A7DC|nr:toprim domain-containing protein [Pigmentibacter sp. JX0631]WGL60775.1 CHC2 zinc finger domain-containing protein [Pigmentibacter sp. JX0631]
MRLRKHSIQNLIQTINLPEHLQRYIEIKRSGGNAVAKCVFHQDSSPSMYVYSEHYHCYACKAHGSIIDYEMHRTGHSFREVVEALAGQYQIPLEYETTAEEKKNSKETERFEKLQKDLEKTYEFFKANKNEIFQNTQNNLLKNYFNLPVNQQLDMLFTGENKKYTEHFQSSSLIDFLHYDYSNCIVFPLYKDNGKIGGFCVGININTISAVEEECLDPVNIPELKIVTPFPKRTIRCLNWQQIRSIIAQHKLVYVVNHFSDFNYLYKLNVPNVILSLENNLNAAIIKEITNKVPTVVSVVTNFEKSKLFLWNIFKESLNIKDLNFEVLKLNPLESSSLIGQIEKLKLNTKKLWEEVIHSYLQQIPVNNRLFEFNKKILPLFSKIEEHTRKDVLLEQIAQKFFSSSKIIFAKNYMLDNSYNDKRNAQIIEQQKSDFVSETVSLKKQDIKILAEEKEINEKEIEHDQEYLEKTIQFYHKILFSTFPYALEAKKYLEQRGFTIELMQKWKLGLCPASHELSRKIENRSVPSEPLLKLGLVKESKLKNGYYDFFHDRIIIPIYGHSGEPVALSGRIFSSQNRSKNLNIPKYINSSESKLFAKSKILFNFHAAMQAIVTYGYVLVVEGYMDCISLVNKGFSNTVAVMGTSLTTFHLDVLAKVTKRIILCFDSDNAGFQAAKRTFATVYPTKNIDVEFLAVPDGKDPDEFLKNYGAGEFQKLIEKTVPLVNQIAEWLFTEAREDLEVFLRLLKQQMLPIIFQHPDIGVQNEALHFLCDKYLKNIYPEDLRKEQKGLLPTGQKQVNNKNLQNDFDSFQSIVWPALTTTEVKLLLSLLHAKFSELPLRLQNVALEKDSEIEVNERICALAITHQMSKISFSVYLEFLSAMVENQHISLLELSKSNEIQFSAEAKFVIAYVNSDVHILYQYKMEELLKESLPGNVSMISFKNIWDLKNSGFLRFQLRNIRLSAQRGVITAFIAEALLQLELEYIDNALKAFSSFHFDNEIDEQFHDLVTERSRRIKEFGSFANFSLQ